MEEVVAVIKTAVEVVSCMVTAEGEKNVRELNLNLNNLVFSANISKVIQATITKIGTVVF